MYEDIAQRPINFPNNGSGNDKHVYQLPQNIGHGMPHVIASTSSSDFIKGICERSAYGPSILSKSVGVQAPYDLLAETYSEASHLTRDETYYLSFSVLKIGSTLYQIPSELLYGRSQSLDAVLEILLKNDPDDEPTQVQGVTPEEIRSFLSLLCPLDPTNICPMKEDWISILKLSTRWQLHDIRHQAIGALNSLSLTSQERIQFGKAYHISNWVRLGYVSFIGGSNELSAPAEILHSDLDTVCRISQAREALYDRDLRTYHHHFPRLIDPFRSLLLDLFTSEMQIWQARFDNPNDVALCLELVEREAPVTPEEVRNFDSKEIISNIWSARLELRKFYRECLAPHQRSDLSPDVVIEAIFGDEIASLRETEKAYQPSSMAARPDTPGSVPSASSSPAVLGQQPDLCQSCSSRRAGGRRINRANRRIWERNCLRDSICLPLMIAAKS